MKYLAGWFALTLVVGMVAACGGDDDDTADATISGIDASDTDASDIDAGDGDAADLDASDLDGSGLLGFMEVCDPDDDRCDATLEPPLLCWDYPSKGPHCTHECTLDEECEAPSPGCTPQGVCRAP